MQSNPTYLMLGGDVRFAYVYEGLQAQHLPVSACFVPGVPPPKQLQWQECLSQCSVVILPLPAFDAAGRVSGAGEIDSSALADSLQAHHTLLGGALGAYRSILSRSGAQIIDYYDDELLQVANAIPTAEGAIALGMARLPITLHDCRCLVIGYGRIGTLLSQKLKVLGAHVTVSARKDRDLGMIRACGLHADRTLFYKSDLSRFDWVINTVPSPVFRPEHYKEFRPSCLMLELASAPGGIDPAACARHALQYLPGSNLPGHYAPRTAGRAIRDAILRALPEAH